VPVLLLGDIRNLVASGKLNKAVETFCLWVEQNPGHKLANDILLLSGAYHKLLLDFHKGTKTQEVFNTESTKIGESILFFVKECELTSASQDNNPPVFRNYHALSIDRFDQTQSFNNLFKPDSSFQFFFIYGEEFHAHESMFERIAYEKEGKLLDHLNVGLHKRENPQTIIVPPFRKGIDLDDYKKGILTYFFGAMGLPPNEHEPILEKDFAYVLEHSPRINVSADHIWIFLNIEEEVWHPVIIPEVARWFILDFCGDKVEDRNTLFSFFFGVIYEEGSQKVRDEVRQVVIQSDLVKAIPELDMVERKDIEEWFGLYKQFMPRTRERKELLKKCLKNLQEYEENGTYYMDDVKPELEDIIEDINEE
jgi:BMFP domain-containing protein YqiC